MAQAEVIKMEGSPQQLAAWLGKASSEKRYRIVEIDEKQSVENAGTLIDPKSAASIALLQSWLAEAPTEAETIREAEEDLLEFKRNMNTPRKETGARLHFPEAE